MAGLVRTWCSGVKGFVTLRLSNGHEASRCVEYRKETESHRKGEGIQHTSASRPRRFSHSTPMYELSSVPSLPSVALAILLFAFFVLAWRFIDRLLHAWILHRFSPPQFVASSPFASAWARAQMPPDAAAYGDRLLILRAAAIDLAAHSSSSRTRMREFKRLIGDLLAFEEAHHIPATETFTPTTRAE